MALVKKRSNSSRLTIIGTVVVLVAVVGFLLYRQLYLLPGQNGDNTNGAGRGRSVITNFDESILNDSRFTELQSYGTEITADANIDGGQIQPFR
ncbi:MAG: hypothetical protein HY975_02815 [Candidatus Kerfeldbacteria bacterium]|nr:hypothetical protein [Candidatus Kerfeldbacteria bacterium]